MESIRPFKKEIRWIFIIVMAIALPACSDGVFSKKLEFSSEFEYQQRIGNPAVEGSSETSLFFKKELGTSEGASIMMPKYFLWKFDKREWESGGKLYISNDDSLGKEFAVVCVLSPEDGDKLLNKGLNRRELDLEGTVHSYSSSNGLWIDPCEVVRDELDADLSNN